jgi:hypothetical protein
LGAVVAAGAGAAVAACVGIITGPGGTGDWRAGGFDVISAAFFLPWRKLLPFALLVELSLWPQMSASVTGAMGLVAGLAPRPDPRVPLISSLFRSAVLLMPLEVAAGVGSSAAEAGSCCANAGAVAMPAAAEAGILVGVRTRTWSGARVRAVGGTARGAGAVTGGAVEVAKPRLISAML